MANTVTVRVRLRGQSGPSAVFDAYHIDRQFSFADTVGVGQTEQGIGWDGKDLWFCTDALVAGPRRAQLVQCDMGSGKQVKVVTLFLPNARYSAQDIALNRTRMEEGKGISFFVLWKELNVDPVVYGVSEVDGDGTLLGTPIPSIPFSPPTENFRSIEYDGHTLYIVRYDATYVTAGPMVVEKWDPSSGQKITDTVLSPIPYGNKGWGLAYTGFQWIMQTDPLYGVHSFEEFVPWNPWVGYAWWRHRVSWKEPLVAGDKAPITYTRYGCVDFGVA